MREEQASYGANRERIPGWDAERVRALRGRLGLSQQQFADELGVRQQTVSEWETGRYAPRGATARLLGIVAERAETPYRPGGKDGGREPLARREQPRSDGPDAMFAGDGRLGSSEVSAP